MSTACGVCEVTSKDSVVKYRHRAIVLLRAFGQIKDLFSSIQILYTIEDFGSSLFTECTLIMMHRTVFQYMTIRGHQNEK